MRAVTASVVLGIVTFGQVPAPDSTDLVRRAVEYVQSYEKDLGGLIAREDYTFRYIAPLRPARSKRLRSDFLLIRLGDTADWLPFRDVLEVDGAPVKDHAPERLEQLFGRTDPASLRATASRLITENARYNIAWMGNINMPLLAVTFLRPANATRFQFKRDKEEVVDGVRTWRIDYVERARPTLIKQDKTGDDAPASGSFWVRADGAIVKTRLRTGGSADVTEVEVTFCQAPSLKMLVPCTMHEHYTLRSDIIVGEATYSDVRRFIVTTDVR